MYSNVTIRMDQDIKVKMGEICKALGMTTSTAFNLFAHAFVRNGGMPFDVSLKEPVLVSKEKALEDTDILLSEFVSDYKRMAE